MSMTLSVVDYSILGVYFVFVLGIGFFIRKRVSTSEDFLTSHRSVPVWITSLAFIAANLGAQARGSARDGFRRCVHDAVLLRKQGPQRTRISQTSL